MANQNSPLAERKGMDLYLTPPWVSLNTAKAIKLGVLIAPQEQKTIERGQPFLMVCRILGLPPSIPFLQYVN